MVNNKYIVKNMGPWMMDELMAFSKITDFDIVFLRNPESVFQKEMKKLRDNNVNIFIEPSSRKGLLKKCLVVLGFVYNNLFKFKPDYNSVIGIKSIYWFLKLDISRFSQDSNIHAQFATQASVISLLIKKYYNNKPKISFTFHAHDIYFKNRWFKLLVNECNKSFSISEYNIGYVQNNYLHSPKTQLARLGVFRDGTNHFNRYANKDTKEVRIGVLSYFVKKKGIEFLLNAMKVLVFEKKLEPKLIIAGDGPLKKEYIEIIKKNNLQNHVFLIGKVQFREKTDFFESLDLFVLPSISLKNDQDGIPVVLMEAISYGLPIISTDVSGIPEICIDDYNGYLIEEKSVDAIVKSVEKLIVSDKKRIEFSNNSFLKSEEYDIDSNSKIKLKNLEWV